MKTTVRLLAGLIIFLLSVNTAKTQTTVVDIVVNSAAHDTLEAAVVAAGLADDLSGDGPFTVFAPTDDAFKALPAGTIETLLEDPTGDLADILLYHVVSGKALSTDLSNSQVIETLLGKDITVTINGEGVFINDAKVTVADIEADNGVVHVIDAVLLPPVETGLLDISKANRLDVFPNPATDFIRLPGLSEVDHGIVKIIDINGAVVFNKNAGNLNERIDISNVNPGSYVILLETQKGRYAQKLLVR